MKTNRAHPSLETLLSKTYAAPFRPATMTARRPLQRRGSALLALEQRFVFDGAAVTDVAHAALDASARAAMDARPAPAEVRTEVRAVEQARHEGKKEVVFVDKSIVNYQTLESILRSGVEVVEIDGGKSGLAQIGQWAASHRDYDAIHILSHGSSGTLYLGTDAVTSAQLASASTQAEFAALGQALKPDGDLLVYACDLAAGDSGRQLVAGIAAATGADVAASTDITGNSTKQGDWTLEHRTGAIETSSIVEEAKADAYAGILTLPNTTTTFSSIASNTDYTTSTTGAVKITATDVASSGWNVVADSSGSTAPFLIRGIPSIGSGSIRVQGDHITYIDFRLNVTGYTFDLTTLDIRSSLTGNLTLEALDSSYNVISNSAMTITIGTASTFVTGNVSNAGKTSSFNDITGFRITVPSTSAYAPYFDNIVISDLKAASSNSAPTNSVVPAISGSSTVGNALASTNGTWSDADSDTLSYSYQWYRATDSSGSGST
ncbi:MAG: DUF4347 domain-containing protein, partial [Burkholderiaceae bacterium]|nr:DUF4347 domain-containing protein [Burkholderiaceae bacterium]